MQTRVIHLKITITISCFNCAHCQDDDNEDYICRVTGKNVGDANTELNKILECDGGKDWKLDNKISKDYILSDLASVEIVD